MNVRHDKIIKNLYNMFLEYEQLEQHQKEEDKKNQKKKKTRRAGKKIKTKKKKIEMEFLICIIF